MEKEKVGKWTDSDRTQCNFKLSHKFNWQDAFALVKGYRKDLKFSSTKCSQAQFLMKLTISSFLNLFSKKYFMLSFGKHA